MPTVSLSRKELLKALGRHVPEKELFDRIDYLGTPVERHDENEIVVEVSPNRPDMLSDQGFSRALKSFMGIETGIRKYKVKPSDCKVIVSPENKDIRPYTACCIVKGLKLDDEKIREIIQIQEKLHVTYCRKRKKAAIGIYPLEKIKFPVHFKAAEPEKIVFRPLEFPASITASRILEEHPAGREYRHLVEGLPRYAYFEDSEGKILSFTPISNSHETGRITEKTKQAFIEVSGFDLATCENVLNIIACDLADMGAKVFSVEVEYPDQTIVTPVLTSRQHPFDLAYVSKILGLDIGKADAKVLLEKMGFALKGKNVLIPPYRADIMHMRDFAEDIAIAYGYENFKEEIPQIMTIGQESRMSILNEKITELLVGLGYLEASTLHLINKEKQTVAMGISDPVVEIKKSVSKEHDSLRRNLLPVMLEVLEGNKHNEYPQKLFTIGKVFIPDEKEETNVREEWRLSVVSAHRGANFTEIKQTIEYLFKALGKDCAIVGSDIRGQIRGRGGRVMLEEVSVGTLGEQSPDVLSRFQIETPICSAEIMLSKLVP